jgi:hypothetical protein
LFTSIAIAYGFTSSANAADPGDFQEGIDTALKSDPDLSKSKPEDVLKKVIQFILGLVAILAGGMLIAGGAMTITSAGNEEKAKRGKTLILYAIIGLLIIGASAIAVNIIINVIFGSA